MINDEFAGRNVLVVYYADEWFGVPYSRDLAGKTLTFDKVLSNDAVYPFFIRDRETGSTWKILGQGIEGNLKGSQLVQLPAHNSY